MFFVGKRTGSFVHWEPIYIGTNADPYYDERLSWEGRSDKMTQVSRKLTLSTHCNRWIGHDDSRLLIKFR